MTTFGISTTIFGQTRPGAREFEGLASHGFAAVELAIGPGGPAWLAPSPGAQASPLRADAAAAGLEIASVSVAVVDALPALPFAADLGCRLLVVRTGPCAMHGPVRVAAHPDPATLRRAIEPIAERAAAMEMAVALAFPASVPSTHAVAFIESFDESTLGACLDTGHAHLADGVPDAIEQLAGYILTTHAHDNHGREDSHRVPCAGSIDWPVAMMELEKTGYGGRILFEIAPEPDVATALARAVGARTRLQAILDDLAQPIIFQE